MRLRNLRLMPGGVTRKRLLAGLALAVALAAVLIVVISVSSPSTTTAANTPNVSGAATVQRRDLVETDTEAGTLSYSSPQTVYNRLSGTITWLPQIGQVIKQGQALFDIDGAPVILMDGTTPAYRDLTPGMSNGSDVLQLNADLIALGFNPDGIAVNDQWQDATTAGVEAWQNSLGETETGTISLGQVVFLPGDQLIAGVNGTLGSTGGGSGASATSTPVLATQPEYVSLTLPGTTTTDEATSSDASATSSDPSTATPAASSDVSTECSTTGSSVTTTETAPCSSTSSTTATSSPTTTSVTTATSTPPVTTSAQTTTTRTYSSPTTTTTSTGTGHGQTGSGSSLTVQEETLQALIALLKAQEKSQASSGKSSSSLSGTGGSTASSSRGGGSSSSLGGTSSAGSSGASSAGSSSAGSAGGSSSSGSSSSGAASTSAILTTTSTQLIVTVDLSASSQSEAVLGEQVTVEMPDGSVIDGKITGVSPVAVSSSSSGSGSGSSSASGSGAGGSSSSSATVPVTIELSGHHTGAGLDQASVSVNFAQAKANNVLSVPVTALLATSGGNYAVQEAAAPHSLIPVTTGLFAAGYVQISGPGIYPGLQVTDSQG